MGQSEYGQLSEVVNPRAAEKEVIDSYVEKYSALNGLLGNTQSIYFIFNYHTLELEFLTDNAYDLTGKDKEYFSGSGEALMRKIFSEDDLGVIFREARKEFQEIRNRHNQEEAKSLSFQIFTRLNKNLCGGRNHLFQFQVLESDHNNKPILCFGSVTEAGFATIPQYTSIAVNYHGDGRNQILLQKRYECNNEGLSNREVQVVKLLTEGMISQDVADTLNISVKTVNNHRQNILRKLKAKTTSEVVRYAVLHGLY